MPDDTPAPDFAGLLARAAGGDAAAVGELTRWYEPKIRMVARALLGPALRPYLDSVDLAQSVHKSILIGLRDNRFALAGPDQLVGLAVTVLRRKAAKHWRHLQRQRRLSGVGTAPDAGLSAVLTSLSSPEADPTAAAQMQDHIERLCTHLSAEERQVLDLRLEGHTPAEIADRLGVNRITLRVRLTRLRERLEAAGVVAEWL